MEFGYKKSKILGDLLFGFLFLIFTIFISIMILQTMIINWNKSDTQQILFSIISIILFSFLTYLILRTAFIRNSYYRHNLKVEIKIDAQKKKIVVINKLNLSETEIQFDEIESVELYYSWNTNTFSSDLGYSKLNLFNNERSIIITQNNLNQSIIHKILKNKVVKNKSNFTNSLKL
ncbi:hypothetical protein [Flavobacterium tegetincola]|uniref:hypothetical protein n=1 Tax=Flavobacterium tegetincola TaxID=150172 RepID=UPI00047A2587|nr:hypothetical protein [Flavobacterium tegetincola]